MPAIESADAAVEVAEPLVKRYHLFRVLKRAQREGANWIVEFDVGATQSLIVRITLDAETGKLVEYQSPGKLT